MESGPNPGESKPVHTEPGDTTGPGHNKPKYENDEPKPESETDEPTNVERGRFPTTLRDGNNTNPYKEKEIKWKTGSVLNVQGLIPSKKKFKLNYLADMCKEQNCEFLALTETHMDDDVLDAEVGIKDYDIYRQDRVGRKNGGVLIYIKKHYNTKCVFTQSDSFCEQLVVEVKDIKLVIALTYRPPNCPKNSFLKQIKNLDNLLDGYEDWNIMLLGDYNFPFLVNWNEVNPFIHSIESEQIQSVHLSNLLEKHLLQQIIDIPTRGKNILDLVMINNQDLVTKSEVVVNKVISDHNTINMRLGLTIDSDTDDSTDEPADTEVDINKVDDIDFFRVRWALNKVEWEVELENKDTDEALSFFMNKMNEVNRILLPPKGKKKEDFEENNKTEK